MKDMNDNQQENPAKNQPEDAGLNGWELSELSSIDRVIAVMSGKGGVGKSTVAALTGCALAKRGFKTGILDADITGPSIPKMFGLKGRMEAYEHGLLPLISKASGIEIASINLLVETEDTPVVWRGPLLSGMVKQFWTDVTWGKLDFLVIDLPPGTGDVPLSVMQMLPVDGFMVVSSPQDLAVMVVKKALKMAEMLDKSIVGLVENMSYAVCPGCGEKIDLFGPAQGQRIAADLGLRYIGGLPVDPALARLCDQGRVEEYENPILDDLAEAVLASADRRIGTV